MRITQIVSYQRAHIFLPFTHRVFFSSPVRSQFVPDAPSIVSPPLVLLSSCGCTGRLSSFSFALIATTLYFSISRHLLVSVDHCIGSFVTCPSHGSPHTALHTEMASPSVPISFWPLCMSFHNSRPMSLLFALEEKEEGRRGEGERR